MIHYPVTTSFWRGMWNPLRTGNKPIRRACDWGLADRYSISWAKPTCPDCVAYKGAMKRMGYLPAFPR